MLKAFKTISILEGISFLAILFITMPLKYIWDNGKPNQFIGMAHGVLFILYIIMAVFIKSQRGWSLKTLLIVWLCSVIPFGTFWMDKKYLN